MKLINSLRTKLTLSFVLLITIISSGVLFYVLAQARTALKDIVRAELETVASITASQLDPAMLDSIKKGEENTSAYLSIKNTLKKIQGSSKDIKYVYTMRREGKALTFIVDPEYGNPKDPGAAIGEEYKDITSAMRNGFFMVDSEKETSSDQWGTTISGYAPVFGAAGRSVGMVGVDMDASVLAQKQNFLSSAMILIVGLGIIFAGIMILFISATIIRDINKLSVAANKISTGDTNVTIDVKRDDEIGELADSFSRMVASLKIMMMPDNDNQNNK